MANKNEIDFDAMSDEDFLKLSEEDAMAAVQPDPEEEEDPNAQATPEPEEDPENLEGDPDPNASGDDTELDGSGDDPVSTNDDDPEGSPEGSDDPEDQSQTLEGNADSMAGEGNDPAEGDKPKDGEKPKTPAENADGKKTPEGEVEDKAKAPESSVQETTAALDFFKKVTASFKADGKDFSVRTPEEAIRLMQQGVNYSRRMHDLKPMKAMNRLLTDHGLNDEAKISFLIDVAKGEKAAISKLLKDKGVDPLDLDVSSENSYQAKSYAGNPQEVAFRDALDTTLETPDGKALVGEIHDKWDNASKAKLQERPEILGNLLDLKQSGDYGKIVDELDRQKALGYLTHVPFLQAFDQVGEAMKNVGLLGQKQPADAATPMGQLQGNTRNQGQPVASGARKAMAPKKAQPNPHLSSTPPSKPTKQKPAEVDYDKMSDEDFLKMAPPS